MQSPRTVLDHAVATGAVIGGVAIAATADELTCLAPFGAGQAGGPPVVADAPFRIASMTKAMTTVAVLQLVEAGSIGLDDDVAAVLPEFGELPVLDGFDGDEPQLRPPARQATVRELLNHTAGLGYRFLSPELARWHAVTGTPDALTFTPALFAAPLIHDPGTRWAYGTGPDWAGRIVEAVSGRSLEEYLRERLWAPLGMTRTTFLPDASLRARLLPLHSRTPDGALVPNGVELPWPPEICSGGAGVYSTAADFGRFMRALLRGGELDGARVLGEASVHLMFTPSLGEVELPEVLRSLDPLLCNDVPAAGVPESWGLGLHLVLDDLPGRRRAGTGDWAGLFNCYFWIDRASGVCGALQTQVLPYFDACIVDTAVRFESAVYATRA